MPAGVKIYFREKAAMCRSAERVTGTGEQSERTGQGRDRCEEEALVFHEMPLCQSDPAWQGGVGLSRRSAGSNMCLHHNVHCDQKLTAD